MKAAAYAYRTPATLPDALAVLAADPSAVPLAGGQSLVPMLNRRQVRPGTVVDLNRVSGLDGVRRDAQTVRIGAMTRLHVLETDTELASTLGVLTEAIRHVAHHGIRLHATLGGSLCHADPGAELPAVMIALGARLQLRNVHVERTVAATDFFTGAFRTARAPDELLTEVHLPLDTAFEHRFAEINRRGENGLPLVSLTIGARMANGRVSEARMAASGVGPAPTRLGEAEQVLLGRRPDERVDDVADAAADACEPVPDLHGSAEYRRQLLRVLFRRTLATFGGEVG